MEDSFNLRVQKAFGSLPAPAMAMAPAESSSSLSNSLWCLTDEEIERREWLKNKGSPKHDDDEPKPYPSKFDGFFAPGSEFKSSDLQADLDDLDEEEEEDDDDDDDNEEDKEVKKGRKLVKPDGYDDETWDIRSSIGLDCTLDNEEEDDEFDKVAVGKQEAVDSFYLRDITDYEADMNSYNQLPITFGNVNKDPRANRLAAKIRLQEDAEEANGIDGVPPSLKTSESAVDASRNDIGKDSVGLNSILKNKGNHIDSKSKKRVRFDSSCKDDSANNPEGSNILSMETSVGEEKPSFLPKESSTVPDYVRNPSKYKHYTFDMSPDIDEASNRSAFGDFMKLARQADVDSRDEIPFEIPKSVTFMPKKKQTENTMGIDISEFEQNQKKRLPIAMEAEDEHTSGICAMEEDEPERAADDRIRSSQKAGRRYRTKDNE